MSIRMQPLSTKYVDFAATPRRLLSTKLVYQLNSLAPGWDLQVCDFFKTTSFASHNWTYIEHRAYLMVCEEQLPEVAALLYLFY